MSLIKKRDEMEAEILRMLDELSKHNNVGMDEPLVDNEGYPRSDIDICAVRHLRHDIICKKNDCKDLTKEIEQGLHVLHAGSRPASATIGDGSSNKTTNAPFGIVDVVDDGSPAQKADLCVGDLVTKFGSVTTENFDTLHSLAAIVGQNVGKPIRVNVVRNSVVVPLILVPQSWNGPGFLGCKIIPLKLDR